jgi:hypothetical protein
MVAVGELMGEFFFSSCRKRVAHLIVCALLVFVASSEADTISIPPTSVRGVQVLSGLPQTGTFIQYYPAYNIDCRVLLTYANPTQLKGATIDSVSLQFMASEASFSGGLYLRLFEYTTTNQPLSLFNPLLAEPGLYLNTTNIHADLDPTLSQTMFATGQPYEIEAAGDLYGDQYTIETPPYAPLNLVVTYTPVPEPTALGLLAMSSILLIRTPRRDLNETVSN